MILIFQILNQKRFRFGKISMDQINNDKKFNYTLQKPFEYDVQYRSPSTEKAKKY